MASLTVTLFAFRVQDYALRHPHPLELGIFLSLAITAILFHMADSENNDKQGQGLSEVSQSSASITGSTITDSTIDASATVHHHNKGVGGKSILAIFLIIAIALGSYLYIHRNDGDCYSGSNGPATANGPASRAVSGNCNK
jgi:hypothetical protein